MQLHDWMRRNRYRDKLFAREISALLAMHRHPPIAASTVGNWRRGICVPRMMVAHAIDKFTDGQVTYADLKAAVRERRMAA